LNHQSEISIIYLSIILHSKWYERIVLLETFSVSGQTKRIAPLSFFHGCTKGLQELIPGIDCDQTAMGLPLVTSAVFLTAK
jgi:hypothetical protein